MSFSVIAASLLLLVSLFLKVPVFISIMGGSITYFILTPSTNPIIFAQKMIGAVPRAFLSSPFPFSCAPEFS